jgi:hypothetical protein
MNKTKEEIERVDRLDLLVNWNVALIKDGIKRMVNGL